MVCVLGSGSAGNAILVEGPRGWILVDAGLPWQELRCRAAKVGISLTLPQIVLTHEHADHIQGLDTLVRRGATLAASPGTLRSLGVKGAPLTDGIELCGITVRPFPVPHDAAEPIGLRLEMNSISMGIATDLGQVTDEVFSALSGCDLVVLEANHDVQLLLNGPYPWPLKRRIMGPNGHLANDEAGRTLSRLAGEKLRTAFLAHLSQKNNTQALALETVARAMNGWQGELYLTYPDRPSAVVPV